MPIFATFVFRTFALALTLAASGPAAFASDAKTEPLTIDKCEEDQTLTHGKTAADFFADRAKNTSCRKELQTTTTTYLTAAKTLKDAMVAAAAGPKIDNAEKRMVQARKRMLEKMEECGPCATRPVERRVNDTPSGTEVWYVSDGSCQLSLPDAAKYRAAYDRVADSLTHLHQYAKGFDAKTKAPTGFNHVLAFVAVDETTGRAAPEIDKVTKNPFYSFIAIRGPGESPVTSFNYYFKNDVRREAMSGGDEMFDLAFNAASAPETFRFPKIQVATASGRSLMVIPWRLASVNGRWCVNSKGYLRYRTAADFRVNMDYAAEFARFVLLDTLTQLSERAVEAL